MNRRSVEVETYYQNFLKSITKKVEVELKKALHETWADFFVVLDERVHTIFNSAIQDFYSDYSPEYYTRDESLYDILQTRIDSDSLSVWFDPDKMTAFRSGYSGEDGLYDQVFRHGWHGGAASGADHPSAGVPYWRAPVPYYSRWGHEASMSVTSPLEDIKRRIADYEKSEMQADFNRIWNAHVSEIKID